MPYVPDPTDVTQPTDAIIAETAQAEFRALKVYIAANLGGNLPGIAQAWAVFDGTTVDGSGNCLIVRAFNIPTIHRNGTGDYTITFGGAFPSADYVMAGSVRAQSNVGQDGPKINNSAAPTTTTCRIYTTTLGGVVADSDRISVVFFDHH